MISSGLQQTVPTKTRAHDGGFGTPLGSTDLINRLQRDNPELLAEDAFIAPLWFSQQKTWLREPIHSDSCTYNYPMFLRMRGPLNEGALQRALEGIVQRHGTLRSVFRIFEGKLVQIVVPAEQLVLSVTDLSGLTESTRDTRVQQLAREEAARPFDLARGPLLRGQLFRLAPDD